MEPTENKARVLDAVEKLFMTRGYQSVSMREIADVLGIRPSSLYYYAPQGKEQLFYEATARSLDRHRKAIEQVIARHNPDFRAQMHAVAAWFASTTNLDAIRMLQTHDMEISAHYRDLLSQASYTALMRPLVVLIEVNQARGFVRAMKPEPLAGGLLSMVTWVNYLNDLPSFPGTTPTDMVLMIDVLLDGCWVGPR